VDELGRATSLAGQSPRQVLVHPAPDAESEEARLGVTRGRRRDFRFVRHLAVGDEYDAPGRARFGGQCRLDGPQHLGAPEVGVELLDMP
jgi:hypothetical protein